MVTKLLAAQAESDRCVSWLWEEEEKCFIPGPTWGLSQKEQEIFSGLKVKSGYISVFDEVLATRTPVIVEEPAKVERMPSELVKALRAGKSIYLPILCRKKVIGLIAINCKNGACKDTRDVISNLNAILSTLGFVLESISLARKSKEKVFQLASQLEIMESLRRMDVNILSTAPLEDSLREMENIIPFDTATFLLIDWEKKCVKHEASIGRTCSLKDIPLDEPVIKELLGLRESYYRTNLPSESTLTACDKEMIARGIRSTIHVPARVDGKTKGWLLIGSRSVARFGKEHLYLVETFANQLSLAWSRLRAQQELKDAFEGIIRSFSVAIDAKSSWTRGHSENISKYAAAIARAMELDEGFIKKVELAGLLHDIGKLGTSAEVLDKPGKLTPEERKLIEQHSAKGKEILAPVKWFKDILPCIRHHHERWDGKGYPDKIKGEKIPLCARILLAADAYDAMVSDRPYRKALSHTEAIEELTCNKSTQFDPEVVDAFVWKFLLKT